MRSLSGWLAPSARPQQLAAYADHQQRCASGPGAAALLSLLRAHEAPADLGVVPDPALRSLEGGQGVVGVPQPPGEAGAAKAARVLRLALEDRMPFFSACDAVVQAAVSFTRSGAVHLTSRERAVLRELSSGHTNRRVAGVLGISEHTAAKHASNLFRKLNVTSRCAAVARGHQMGLLDPVLDGPLCS